MPLTAKGKCRRCGEPCWVQGADAEEYERNPHRGMLHLVCPVPTDLDVVLDALEETR